MSGYISRKDAIDGVRACCLEAGACNLQCIKGLTAADVVPVVRCRDCKYYYKDADGYEMCDNSEGYDHVSAEGFCAWALRRDSK